MIELGAPRKFYRGSSVEWRVRHKDYDPAVWTLTVALVEQSDRQTITGADYADGSFLVALTPAESLNYREGFYRFQESVSDGTDVHIVGRGVIEVLPTYINASSGHDSRSHAAKMWDSLTATLEEKAKVDQSSLSQSDQSMSRYQWQEMLEAKGHYAHQMTDDERIARGYKPRQQRHVRFCR